jgi:hypothetical protein
MTIITNAGRTAEKWEAARNNLGLKNQFKPKEKSLSRFRRSEEIRRPRREERTKPSERSDRKKFKKDKRSKQGNTQTAGIESSELQRR